MGGEEEFQHKIDEICPMPEGGEGERFKVVLPYCTEVPLLASQKREIRILCRAGLVMLHVNDIPLILEQGQDTWASGVVRAHGMCQDRETVICYRIFR